KAPADDATANGIAANSTAANGANANAAAAPSAGPVLHFHLLIPRNYPLSQDAINAKLTEALRAHDPKLSVHIDFISSFV
ncbi:MAG: hypothetical protein PHT80_04240, partial [Lentisphaeria bacterium]|nr:hypothetical protein [Lentisphaeria bacterium]